MIIAAYAVPIQANVASTQRQLKRLCLRTGAYGYAEQHKLSDIGQRCMDIIKRDRAIIKRQRVLERIAKLKSEGVNSPRQLLKATMNW